MTKAEAMEVDWQKAAAEFKWDGSLRDIYVLNATISDWDAVLEMIRGLSPAPIYLENNTAVTMPDTVKSILEKRENGIGTRLDFMIGNFLLQCHFFWSPSDYDIEFTLDPRDMKNIDELRRLVDFMSRLIILTKKTVVLTHESFKDGRIIEGVLESNKISWVTNSWMAQAETEKTEMGFKVGDNADK